MKTFQDYCDLKELAAYDVGTSILGRSSLQQGQEKAMTAALQAFEMIMAKNSSAAVSWLNRMAQAMPEVKTVLQQHGLDSFKDVSQDMRAAARKGRRVVSKGLADVGPDDVKNPGVDVIAASVADSHHNPLG
jgi:hypothetical protein